MQLLCPNLRRQLAKKHVGILVFGKMKRVRLKYSDQIDIEDSNAAKSNIFWI